MLLQKSDFSLRIVKFVADVLDVELPKRPVPVPMLVGFCVDCDRRRLVNPDNSCHTCGSYSVDMGVYQEPKCVVDVKMERAYNAAEYRVLPPALKAGSER